MTNPSLKSAAHAWVHRCMFMLAVLYRNHVRYPFTAEKLIELFIDGVPETLVAREQERKCYIENGGTVKLRRKYGGQYGF